jgi:hypothetical protein
MPRAAVRSRAQEIFQAWRGQRICAAHGSWVDARARLCDDGSGQETQCIRI